MDIKTLKFYIIQADFLSSQREKREFKIKIDQIFFKSKYSYTNNERTFEHKAFLIFVNFCLLIQELFLEKVDQKHSITNLKRYQVAKKDF